MGHFTHNAQSVKTAEWIIQSQLKLCQLQVEELRVFVFVKHVSQFTITEGQEGRKHQQMVRSVKSVVDFPAEDRKVTRDEISQGTGVSPTSVFRILTDDLQ
jgi:hypothetical protein